MSSLWKVSKTSKMLKCHDLIASEMKFYLKHLSIVWTNTTLNFRHWWRKSHFHRMLLAMYECEKGISKSCHSHMWWKLNEKLITICTLCTVVMHRWEKAVRVPHLHQQLFAFKIPLQIMIHYLLELCKLINQIFMQFVSRDVGKAWKFAIWIILFYVPCTRACWFTPKQGTRGWYASSEFTMREFPHFIVHQFWTSRPLLSKISKAVSLKLLLGFRIGGKATALLQKTLSKFSPWGRRLPYNGSFRKFFHSFFQTFLSSSN